ncbi:MAG: hypothetical protein JXB04_01430 [Kiritimatiellae bacterium]|nr:hypothetical protein [Kiritimatiellia bacterium]
MADKKTTCKGDHKGHLCVLASKGMFDKIKELARDPQFICFNCGRVADSDKNLCNPMPLD